MTNVCFKTVQYGEDKGDLFAVLVDTINNGRVETFHLFEGHGNASVDYIQSQTRTSTEKEYLSTLNTMKQHYGYDVNVVDKIKTK